MVVTGPDGRLPLPWLAEPLQRARAQMQGHAWLVQAAPGIGALPFALCLAQAWLCEAAQQAAGPCGSCASCRLVQGHVHPDLFVVQPERLALEAGFPVEVDERRKPSQQIRVEEVRRALDWVVTTSGRGRGKVLVLHPAQAMNAISASALLKTLEEPPQGVRILLTASDPARLLPTIVSRCQRFALAPPARDQALAWLAEQGVPEAATLLVAAGDEPLSALQWHRAGVDARSWLALPRALASGDASALERWPVPLALDALLKLCHDAMAWSAGGSPRYFASTAWPAEARQTASLPRLAAWQRELMRVAAHAEHPWNEPLLLEALVVQGQRAWDRGARRRPAGRAFDTLVS